MTSRTAAKVVDFRGRSPFGLTSLEGGVALFARRYLHQFGYGQDALFKVVDASRQHASDIPEAICREPLHWDIASGLSMISTWVVVRRKNLSDFDPPYFVAQVELDEWPRLTPMCR